MEFTVCVEGRNSWDAREAWPRIIPTCLLRHEGVDSAYRPAYSRFALRHQSTRSTTGLISPAQDWNGAQPREGWNGSEIRTGESHCLGLVTRSSLGQGAKRLRLMGDCMGGWGSRVRSFLHITLDNELRYVERRH